MDYQAHKISPKKVKGFTIVELMVTLAIAAILITVGLPSLTTFFQDNLLATQTQTLRTAISYSREEAVRRNTSVSICRSSDQATCVGNWQNGWIVFTDPDEDGVVDAGELVLRVGESLAPNNIVYSNAANFLGFDNQGFLHGNFAGQFTISDTRGADGIRCLGVNVSGRVSPC